MRRLLACLALLAAAASAAAEDVLVLKNGREISGRIVEEKPESVKMQLGFGTMTWRRDQIAEIRREAAAAVAPAPAAGEAPAPDPSARREEHSLVYVDGERVGTRTFRAVRQPEGFLFEEEIRLLDAAGKPRREVRTTERADLQYRPLTVSVRETDGEMEHSSLSGEVVAGRLRLSFLRNGDRKTKDVAVPADARFPFAARELFLRETRALSGRFDCDVFDPRDSVFRAVSWRESGVRPLRLDGVSLEARVVARQCGDVVEREWLARDLVPALAEIAGQSTVTIATTREAVARLRAGDTDRLTGPDSAARTVYADRERGWRIGKPDPTWTFEKPDATATGALLSVRNEPLFASVDVLTDPDARRDVKPESAAEALQRLCRTVASDFAVAKDGWIERDGLRIYWMEATATTRGEKTRTLARVIVKDGVVWRILAACPAGAFEMLRPELGKIVESFVAE